MDGTPTRKSRAMRIQWINVLVVTGFAVPAFAQQNVFSRSDSGSNLWENNSALPWYYQTWNNNQRRPDLNSPTRNSVFIGHNAHTTYDVNTSNWYTLGSLTLQSGITNNLTFNSSGGAGISLTSGFTNQSSGNMTFNVPFGIDASPVTFTNSGAGLVTATTNVFINANTLRLDGAGNFSFSGVLQGSGGKLEKLGAGNTTLSNSNSYSGGTTVSSGTLSLGHATNTLADAGAVTVNGGTLALGSNSDTVGAVTLTSGSITGAGTLTGSSYSLSSGTVDARLGGGAGLTKSGPGTVTLGNANTYSGNTSIAAGTLSLASTGSIDNSVDIDVQTGATLDVAAKSGYTVQAGQTLRGNGTVRGTVSVTGTLSPGAASTAGKLTIDSSVSPSSNGHLLLNNGAILNMDIDGTARGVAGGYDAVDAAGSLSYEGTLNVDLASTFPNGTSFNLFDFTGEGGFFDAVNLTGAYSGPLSPVGLTGWAGTFGSQAVTYTYSTGVLAIQAIPEPLTAAGVMLLAGRVVGRRNRVSL